MIWLIISLTNSLATIGCETIIKSNVGKLFTSYSCFRGLHIHNILPAWISIKKESKSCRTFQKSLPKVTCPTHFYLFQVTCKGRCWAWCFEYLHFRFYPVCQRFHELNEAEWRIDVSANWPSLVQIMACRLVGTKPLYELMLEYC